MTIKRYFTIISVIGIVFGVGFLLAPEQLGSVYGIKESPDVELGQRLFGAALLAWALIAWFAKDFRDAAALRGVLIGSAVGHAAGVLVSAFGVLSGVMNFVGWSSALIFLFGALGSIYFLMARSQTS
jgi:hypothetical protein